MCLFMHVWHRRAETKRDSQSVWHWMMCPSNCLLKNIRVTSKQSWNVHGDPSQRIPLPYASLSFCRCPRLPVWTSRSFSAGGKVEGKNRGRERSESKSKFCCKKNRAEQSVNGPINSHHLRLSVIDSPNEGPARRWTLDQALIRDQFTSLNLQLSAVEKEIHHWPRISGESIQGHIRPESQELIQVDW